MCWFRKKYIYKVVWRYSSICASETVYVKATDIADAWKKVQRQHFYSIDCVSIEKIEE